MQYLNNPVNISMDFVIGLGERVFQFASLWVNSPLFYPYWYLGQVRLCNGRRSPTLFVICHGGSTQ